MEALLASGHATQAADGLRPLADRSGREGLRARLLLAEALHLCGRDDDAALAADLARLDALRVGGDTEKRKASAILALALLRAADAGSADRARRVLEEAEIESGAPQSAYFDHARGVLLLREHRLVDARLALLQALAGARADGHDRQTAVIHESLGQLHARTGDADRARQHYETGLALLRGMGDARGEATLYGHLGRLSLLDEAQQSALREFDRSCAAATTVGDRFSEVRARNGRGMALLQLEQVQDAERELVRARLLAEEQGFRRLAALCHRDLAQVAQRRGDLESTTRRTRRAARRFLRMDDLAGVGFCHLVQGRAFVGAGRKKQAASQFARAVKLLRDSRRFGDLARALVELAEASLPEHPNGAARWLAEAEEVAREHLLPHVLTDVRAIRSRTTEHLPGHSVFVRGDRHGVSGETRYLLLERLRAPAGSEVWRALDERAGRMVRLERVTLPGRLGGQDRTLERLTRELDAALGVDHPNVARLFGSAVQGLDVLIFAEHVPGLDLASRLDAGPLDADLAWRWIAEIGAGLDALHAAGTIHRDVRPGNVVVREDGSVALQDYGAGARAAGGLIEEPETSGTRGYMAPEQVLGWVLDFRTDLFSYGMLAAELLTGTNFILDLSEIRTSRSYREVMSSQQSFDELLAEATWPPHVTTRHREAIERLLAYTARLRPTSAAAFLTAAGV